MRPSNRDRRVHRGMMLQEAFMALVLTSTILGVIAQVTSLIARHRTGAEQRALAVLELGNLMEVLTVRDWQEMASSEFIPELSADCRRQLPKPKLAWRFSPAAGPRELHRLQLTLDWQLGPDRRSSPVTLVGWRRPDKETKP